MCVLRYCLNILTYIFSSSTYNEVDKPSDENTVNKEEYNIFERDVNPLDVKDECEIILNQIIFDSEK
jgi:hypothetical protein